MAAYIFDSETTDSRAPELIEAAWLAMSDDLTETTERNAFLQRYRPAAPISFGAMAIHHILPDELEGCPANTELHLPADMEYMIGHKVDFDWEVVGSPQVKRICTLAMAREVWPVPLHSWEDVFQFSERSRIPKRMPFGKHEGVPIAEVPHDYRAWLLRQADVDPYLRQALEAADSPLPTASRSPSPLRHCAAARDGECLHGQCPQNRDAEPAKSGRHCPLDTHEVET